MFDVTLAYIMFRMSVLHSNGEDGHAECKLYGGWCIHYRS